MFLVRRTVLNRRGFLFLFFLYSKSISLLNIAVIYAIIAYQRLNDQRLGKKADDAQSQKWRACWPETDFFSWPNCVVNEILQNYCGQPVRSMAKMTSLICWEWSLNVLEFNAQLKVEPCRFYSNIQFQPLLLKLPYWSVFMSVQSIIQPIFNIIKTWSTCRTQNITWLKRTHVYKTST